jgi:two-component system sensor histidine kinase PilS (NtrC family)
VHSLLAALGRLSASIAHEIRTPVGAMSHAGQLLAESESIQPEDHDSRRSSATTPDRRRIIENVRSCRDAAPASRSGLTQQ